MENKISKKDISIRKLTNSEHDMELLFKWLSDERVTEYSWNEDLPWTMEKIKEDFKIDEEDTATMNLILYKGEEVGFIQYYPIERDSYKFESEAEFLKVKGAYGLDMFIGIRELWNQGIGKGVISLLTEYLYKEKGISKFTADPCTENESGLIFWQKAGFKPLFEAEEYDDETKRSLIMLKSVKKTLIFNGSPRKNGDTKSLLNILTKELEGDIKIIDCYYANISPCVDCRYCHKKPGCAIKDEMQKVYEYIENCDNVLIASPIYFSEVTGKLLDVVSRLQTYYCGKKFRKSTVSIKPKKGAILLVGGGDGAPDKAISTSKTVLYSMNSKEIMPPVVDHSTDLRPAIEDENTVKGVSKIAEFFNK